MATTNKLKQAIRCEGLDINAYLVPGEGMEGALLIGHIATAAVELDRKLFEDFKVLMVAAMTALLKDQGVTVTGTEERPVPAGDQAGAP